MELKICDINSLHRLAEAEVGAFEKQIDAINIEMDELPFLAQRIPLSRERAVLSQKLKDEEIRAANYLREIRFSKRSK